MNKPVPPTDAAGRAGRERKRILGRLTPPELISTARLDLTAGREASVIKRLEQMPKSSRHTYLKAVAGNSLAAGVKAFCMECIGWERQEVRDCTDLGCSLYPVRSFKGVLE